MNIISTPRIKIYNNYNRFDKSIMQSYNSFGRKKNESSDSFIRTIRSTLMDKNQNTNFKPEIKQLQDSKTMQLSPVAFVVPLIEQFLKSETTMERFSQDLRDRTLEAQFMFSHMPASEIKTNQHIFKREFDFADKLNSTISSATNEAELRKGINQLINQYCKPTEE